MSEFDPAQDHEVDEALLAIIDQYHDLVDRGEPVDHDAFAKAHPEFSDAIRRYFHDLKVVEKMAGPTAASAAEATFVTDQTKEAKFDETIIEQSEPEPARVSTDAPPTKFGRYKILKELGRGAMGAVYLAQDDKLDRKVALKIPQFGGAASAGLLERFYREARAAGNLRHPGICPVYDVGELDGQHYITMAFIEGRPLRDFTKSSKRQEGKQVARVIRKIALAMAEAHEHNVVHRDLKPANVMIDKKNEPVVMDFGLARRATEGEERLTHTGTVIGTPAYMSPEQVDGDNEHVGPQSDIYSLGVIFYEMLAGELPFQGNLMSILKQIALKEPRPPVELHSDIDPTLQALCLKMLAKEAKDRPESMEQVAKELSDWLQGRHAPTDESGELETSRVPGQKRKKNEAVEATDPMTAPGVPRSESLAEEFPSAIDMSVTTQYPRTGILSGRPPKNQKLLLWGGLGGAAILLAGIVFFLSLGGKYDVKITVEDPSISLKVDGEAVDIEGNGAPIRLSAGEHTLHVEMNGFESDTDSFTVKKDGRNAVHVARLDGKLAIIPGDKPVVPADTVASTAKTNSGSPGSGRASSATGSASAPPPAVAPFDVAQAKAHQAAWAKHLGEAVETTNSIGMKFAVIPPGEFEMGVGAKSVHVTLTKPFRFGVHEVTQEQWTTVMETTPWVGYGAAVGPDIAAAKISWNDALVFCRTLTTRERAEGRLPADREYRLPTEAEWEFCCRAGTVTAYSFGDNPSLLNRHAHWSDKKPSGVQPVGRKIPNAWGLYDTHGNLWEWCQDVYIAELPGGIDPLVKSGGQDPVRRGGSWDIGGANHIRSDTRAPFAAMKTSRDTGFRVVVGNLTPPLAVAPFDAAQAKAHQQAWADYLGEPVETTNSIGMKLAVIPPGEFTMGDGNDAVPVKLTKPFRLGIHEVTQDQWKAVMGTEPWKGQTKIQEGEDVPASYLSWMDATEFCSRLTELARADERLSAGEEYRLPTEAEWESACRAGTMTRYSFGNDAAQLGQYAWYEASSQNAGEAYAHGVGLKKPNPWGLYDMHGNLWEWCFDTYSTTLTGGLDPVAESTVVDADRVHRGGSWLQDAENCHSTMREGRNAQWPPYNFGFRVAMTIDTAKLETAPGATNSASAPPPAVAPFDTAKAKAHQQAWADYLRQPVEEIVDLSDGVKMAFVLIPSSEFLMGSTDDEQARFLEATKTSYNKLAADRLASEGSQHQVRITRPFRLSRHEVTVGQFRQFVKESGYRTDAERDGKGGFSHLNGKWVQDPSFVWNAESNFDQTDDHPVKNVSSNDAIAFCQWLSRKIGSQYLLPTEAQWEYACRAGTTEYWHSGDGEVDVLQFGWFRSNSDRRSHPVGQLKPNAFGLFDMHGNESEWCSDSWLEQQKYLSEPVDDPVGPPISKHRVHRGGSWDFVPEFGRSATRSADYASHRDGHIGFRVAQVITEPGRPFAIVADSDRDTTEWIIARGGHVIVNGHDGWISEVTELPAGELQVRLIKFFKPLIGIDADLVPLRELKHLEFLGIDGVNVSTAGLAGLDRLPRLERLSRGTNPLKDEDLAALARLKSLRSLFIAGVRMTPTQCATLARTMPRLVSINLTGNGSLDDAAVAPLGELRGLTTLQLHGTKVTAAGIAELQKALPDCKIEWDGNQTGSASPPAVIPPGATGTASTPPPAVAPFDTATAKQHQQAWAKHLGLPVEYTNSVGMMFVLIPPGEFMMGSTAEEIAAAPHFASEDGYWTACAKGEAPRHAVRISRPFYLGKHEVTQNTYSQLMGNNPSDFSVTGALKERVVGLDTSLFPVEMVGWSDSIAFCNRLSEQANLTQVSFGAETAMTPPIKGNGYRLPTEAEWEFACRAGTTTQFYSGDQVQDLHQVGFSGGNSQHRTHAVGELAANPFGLFDTHGNVWEWVLDHWDIDYYQQFESSTAVDPFSMKTAGDVRGVRGGFWGTPELRCSSSRRFGQHIIHKHGHNGFRVAISVGGARLAMTINTAKLTTTKAPPADPDPPAADYALRFDGDDHVTLPSFEFNFDQPLTVEAIVTPDAGTKGWQSILAAGKPYDKEIAGFIFGRRYQPDETSGWTFELSPNNFGLAYSTQQPFGPFEKQTVHLAGVWDGQKSRLFINGKSSPYQRENKDVEHRRQSKPVPWIVGATNRNDGYHFHGDIDELRISKTARYTTNFTPVQRHEADEHTLALYHFDEGQGDILKDSSGNGHDGKILGAKWVR